MTALALAAPAEIAAGAALTVSVTAAPPVSGTAVLLTAQTTGGLYAASAKLQDGAALFVLVSQQAGIGPADNSRVLQGIIAGVGFLGAGTILKGDAEGQVKGLTTAAGIWLTAAIGVAAGLGQEATAVLTTALALLVLWAIPMLHDKWVRTSARKSG